MLILSKLILFGALGFLGVVLVDALVEKFKTRKPVPKPEPKVPIFLSYDEMQNYFARMKSEFERLNSEIVSIKKEIQEIGHRSEKAYDKADTAESLAHSAKMDNTKFPRDMKIEVTHRHRRRRLPDGEDRPTTVEQKIIRDVKKKLDGLK